MTEIQLDAALERLADAADALAGELSLEDVLDTITQVAAQVTGARYAALGVVGETGTITRFLTHGISEDQIRAIGHYPTGKGILGLLIREPRIIRLEDIQAHPASYGFPDNHPPMTTFIGAPVRSGGRIYGNLYLTEKPHGFDERDEQVLLVLAAQAGSAIENAILSQRLQDLAVQEERDRISRELHDGVIQSLFSIGMGLESARGLIDKDPDRVKQRIASSVDALDGAIRELRNYIFRLRPHEAASLGLERGIAELAREYEVNAIVRPELRIAPALDARVPKRVVPDVLQITREALSNVAKHAGASRVTIRALVAGDGLTLEVEDDGSGFTPEEPYVGHGVGNMRERVQVIGGVLTIESQAGSGTLVRAEIPLTEEQP